jgi:hypothetical protein
MIPLDLHTSLKSHTIQQYFDSASGGRLSLKYSRETFEWARLNQHLGARLETGADFYKTGFINLGGQDFDHPVINRRRIPTYTHNAMDTSSKTHFMKQTT